MCRGDNHMGLSHVLFTAVNGSRHWGPLPFTLRPLGDGGVWGVVGLVVVVVVGLSSWCVREKKNTAARAHCLQVHGIQSNQHDQGNSYCQGLSSIFAIAVMKVSTKLRRYTYINNF